MEECVEGGVVGDEPAGGGSEGDVLHSEGLGVGSGAAGLGVFAYSQEIIERNVGEVSLGFSVWAEAAGGCEVTVEGIKVFGQGHGHGKLGGGAWVLAVVAIELLFQLGPVVSVRLRLVDGVGSSVQFKGLADGAKRVLN